jgi:hypothetical protein
MMRCEDVVSMLDSLQDNELPTQTAAEVNGHMHECLTCSAEWEERMSLRNRMHTLRSEIPVPDSLVPRTTKYVQSKTSVVSFVQMGGAIAAAAVVIVFGGMWASGMFGGSRDVSEANSIAVASVVARETSMSAGSPVADPTTLSQSAGFNVCPVNLPGWTLQSAQLLPGAKSKSQLVRLMYENNAKQKIACYQAASGQINIAELEPHSIGGRKFCCGNVAGRSVVYWPKDGHDFLLIGDLSQSELMDLALKG